MKKLTFLLAAALLCSLSLPVEASAEELLIPVGRVVGLELANDTVTVADFDDALGASAREAGLRVGDEIVAVNGKAIDDPEDIREALAHTRGAVTLTVSRSGRQKRLTFTPQQTPEGPRLGVYLRQGIAGIGTVTWYDPEDGTFAALGHGVNDARGNLLDMRRGSACWARVVSVKKGVCGEPGQLKGAATVETVGTLYRNTAQGVFGQSSRGWLGEPVPVAAFEEIHTGNATIRSTVTGDTVGEYSVEILKVYPQNRADGRNFLLKVTDPDLLSATGGIVQGMGVSYNKDNQWNP